MLENTFLGKELKKINANLYEIKKFFQEITSLLKVEEKDETKEILLEITDLLKAKEMPTQASEKKGNNNIKGLILSQILGSSKHQVLGIKKPSENQVNSDSESTKDNSEATSNSPKG